MLTQLYVHYILRYQGGGGKSPLPPTHIRRNRQPGWIGLRFWNNKFGRASAEIEELYAAGSRNTFYITPLPLDIHHQNNDVFTIFRLSRLASHLLSQHSFYPLYPPNLEQNIDFEHQELHGLLDQSPHLLLLPSDLVYFVRELDSCTILNPGRLTKGPGPGTYSSIKAQAVDGKLSFQAEIVRIWSVGTCNLRYYVPSLMHIY